MSGRTVKTHLVVLSLLAVLCTPSPDVSARSFRVDLIPNGSKFSCTTCHEYAGGPRNHFGLAVESLVPSSSRDEFWSESLALRDSDGDTFTNGQELQDPQGTWGPGDPNPGMLAQVANPGDASSTPPPDAFPTPTPVPPAEEIVIELELIAEGLTSPVEAVNAEDGTGRLFILEQPGRIRILQNDTLANNPFLDLTDRVISLNSGYDERGLLGLAFHPDYENNGYFYVYYSAPGAPGNHTSILAEYQRSADDPNRADRDSERVILEVSQPEGNHNGGRLAFGPDGMLYVGLGDGGGAGDRHGTIGNGQNTETLLGSILRIDVNDRTPYGIPSDNPFVNQPGKDEIWAYGLRNPWKFSFDRDGENRLFCADVGQNQWEEVNIILRGGNYGWRVMEGTHCFNPSTNCDTSGKIQPIAEYSHSMGTSITGGYVYRGTQNPSLIGKYVFGDYSSPSSGRGRFFYLEETSQDEWRMEELQLAPGSSFEEKILSFAEGEDGELYVLGNPSSSPLNPQGVIYRISVIGDEPVGVRSWHKY